MKTANPFQVPAVKYHTPRKDIDMYLSNDRLLTCEKSREVPSDRAAEFGPVLWLHVFTSPRRPRGGVVSWRATGSRSGGGGTLLLLRKYSEKLQAIPQDDRKILVLRHFSSMRTLAREGS